MEIREATAADHDEVSRLLAQLHPEEPGGYHPDRVRQGHHSFVALADGEIVGFLLGAFIDYGIRSEGGGTIEQLVVDAGHRGRGIGERLVEEWKGWLQGEGLRFGFVSNTNELGAQGFYERCGFRPCVGPWLFWSAVR